MTVVLSDDLQEARVVESREFLEAVDVVCDTVDFLSDARRGT
jgi:hypothetical protein